jgi:hypothetical protein
MADSTRAAADLIKALAEAARAFRQVSYAIFLAQGAEVSWQQFSTYGGSDDSPATIVGCLIDLKDGREVEAAVTITVAPAGDEFGIEADITLQDDFPENLTDLLELPEAVAGTVPDCIGKLHEYVSRLSQELPGLVDDLRAIPPTQRAHP